MVHPINVALDKIAGKEAVACNSECQLPTAKARGLVSNFRK